MRSSNPFEKSIKSAKRLKSGRLSLTGHSEYIFRCETKIDCIRWIKALRNELTENPLLDTLANRRAQARGEKRRRKRMSWGQSPSVQLDDEIATPSGVVFDDNDDDDDDRKIKTRPNGSDSLSSIGDLKDLNVTTPLGDTNIMNSSANYSNNDTNPSSSPSKKRIATISAGYADGIFRTIGKKTRLYFEEIGCPIIGRISMDLIGVDITSLNVEPDRLALINSRQTIDKIADDAGTIGYEFLTSLGQRYKRNYTGVAR